MKPEPVHTPTPWKILGDFGEREIHCEAFPIEVARLQGTDLEQQANAAFIVRAVNCHEELLAALKGLVEAYRGPQGMHDTLRIADQAIAKAEGRL